MIFMNLKGYWHIGIWNLIREGLTKILNGESGDLLYHIDMILKDVDVSPVGIIQLGLSEKHLQYRM